MNEKPNYYAIIPGEVRYDPELKDKAKLLYGEITALSNKEGYCFASNTYFAELYNVSNQTIINMINNLVDKGYLERTIIYKKGTKEVEKRYLKIIEGGTQNILTRGTQKTLTRGTQNIFTDNNTSINNTSINNTTTNDNEGLFDYLQENGFSLTPIEYDIVKMWEDNELTRYAIKQAVLNHVFRIPYIESILERYRLDNIKTVQEAISNNETFKNKNKKQKKENIIPEWFDKDLNTKQESEEDDLNDEQRKLINEILGSDKK